MCISGHFEVKSEAGHQNKHSIEIGNEKKANATSCCGQGITRLKIELTPEKLFFQDSPIIETNNLLQEYQIPQHTMAQFYVNNPGNLSDPRRLQLLDQMVFELEHMKDTANGAILLRDSDLPAFLNWPEYEKWRGFVIFNETTLQKFFFTTAYYGENLKEWPERGVLLSKWRAIIDRYREFNVSVYMDDGLFLDLIENMPTDAWQSALGTLVCMAFICFIFLYDTFTVVVVSAAIVSIMTGKSSTFISYF
ncbi:unnamed protein product [Gongylonema pulchrum]|uniref:SSD domain-containing protein n=1 Tax=Gongylonema pulchrum TaxID=637853 RepID=A0A183ED65_9BILA|nr:unnamed protein product [Gongylonema pulchrum]